jgi:hypothetical protein
MGVAASVASYVAAHRSTTVFTTTATITADGIVVSPGTQLIHEASMSEGFDTLRLYLNVDPLTLDRKFQRRVESKAFLVIPYWVRQDEPGELDR